MFSSNTSQVSGGYEIQRSLRFNRADNAFLNRTPASAGNRTTWTWSGWVKRSDLPGSYCFLFNCEPSDGNALYFETNETLVFYNFVGGVRTSQLATTAVYRDASAWYHIVLTWDTTNATSSERIRLYVNGVRVTAFGTATYPAQNTNSAGINTTSTHTLGSYNSGAFGLGGYMTEVNFIDGQALTPSSFGAFDAQTGVWGPTRYAGSYGTNGFYLNFSDNSNTTAATLGRDYSGNSNNWTPNNFSVSAGAGNDSLVDVPTNWGTDTGVGGTVRGNYATMNPIDVSGTGGVGMVLSNGNLQLTGQASNWRTTKASIGMSSGKWYFETTVTSISGSPLYAQVGIATQFATTDNYLYVSAFGWAYINTGDKGNNNSVSAYGATWTTNDVIGVAFDADVGTLTFYKNGTSQGTAFSGLTSGPYFFAASMYDPSVMQVNFGQRPFAYTAPSGFRALNTQNLPTPTIGATTATQASQFFNTVTYTGTGAASQPLTVGFAPDLAWIKSRSEATSHGLYDKIRGVQKWIGSNSTSAEQTYTGTLESFDSNGITVGNDLWNGANGRTYVAWNWRANGTGVTNTAGSITSTVSANTTSGFSVVTYTGNGTAGATVGHGLGRNVAMYFVKNRSASANWAVLGHALNAAYGNRAFLLLNTTNAFGGAAQGPGNSSTIELWNDSTNNASGNNYVAYCFSEVPGYSRFGSYTGNGSADGPFVFCGFRPAYVMWKRTDVANDWVIVDTTRSAINQTANVLYANSSVAEDTGTGGSSMDILSNGFKVRTTNSGINASGGTYIFAAFASAPQKFALAR